MENKNFNVLSLDGGGVRGIFTATILEHMENNLGINLYNNFDLIVGTSTGSIIASAIAIKYDMSRLVADYEKCAPNIFKIKPLHKCKLISRVIGSYKSKFQSGTLEQFLHERFKEVSLGEIEKPLILNATNVSVGGVYVFKSRYQKKQRDGDYCRDGDIPLYLAVLASCSAPMFFDPVDINGTLVCDGGIWANNPALVGYVDAVKNFHKKPEDIRILSIGTGKPTIFYPHGNRWGMLTGWKGADFVNFFMDCQSDVPQNCLDLIMPKRILRINPPIKDDMTLDNCKNISILKSMAKNIVTDRSEEIKNFVIKGE